MISAILLSLALSAITQLDGPATPPPDRDAYERAVGSAGRDSAAQVKLALWCEAHGMSAERLKHLARAVLMDPKNATARGLMGLVEYKGQWKRPEAVAEKVKDDPDLAARLAEYNTRRGHAKETADSQAALAVWCEQNGLDAEAKAHYASVVRLDPSRDAAWKKLGCKKVGGRWVTEEQLAAEKSEADAQKAADHKWKPLLAKYRAALTNRDPAKRDEAEKALDEISDPLAVGSIWNVFVVGKQRDPSLAIRLLGQIDARQSSRVLSLLAVFASSPEDRRAATETLKRRDVREFGDILVGLVHDPIKFQVKHATAPGDTAAILIEDKRQKLLRIFRPQLLSMVVSRNHPELRGMIVPESVLTFTTESQTPFDDSFGPFAPRTLTEAAIRQQQLTAVALQRREARILEATVNAEMLASEQSAFIERYNQALSELSDSAVAILEPISGRDLGKNEGAWQAWWQDQLGFASVSPASDDKPTFIENVPATNSTPGFLRYSCFGAGTLIHTFDGTKPIEALKVGDRVLTAKIKNGSLGYQPVTFVYHNPPSLTYQIKVNGDTIVASPFHRFWVVGKGWIMARDMQGGETLRLLDGPAVVQSVESGPAQPVFNLDVAGDHDFFAGAVAALVHDNSLPDTRLTPFDAAPDLGSAKTSASR